MQPHSYSSIETQFHYYQNVTSSSGTSPSANYKEDTRNRAVWLTPDREVCPRFKPPLLVDSNKLVRKQPLTIFVLSLISFRLFKSLIKNRLTRKVVIVKRGSLLNRPTFKAMLNHPSLVSCFLTLCQEQIHLQSKRKKNVRAVSIIDNPAHRRSLYDLRF